MAATNQSRLLRLSPELRNNIYDLVFTGIVDLDHNYRVPPPLLCCKQVNSEAAGAYWRKSEFRSKSTSRIETFLAALDSSKLKFVSAVVFDSQGGNRLRYERLASAFFAQMDLFLMAISLCGKQVSRLSPGVLKIIFEDVAGETHCSATPWQTMLHRLESATSRRLEHYDILLQNAKDQARFFEFAHESDFKCWSTFWMTNVDYVCDCPMIAEH
ncbi:uncharacterized protein CLAFUR5_10935 [Fulvia fulva]|uniref:Uncharacterized protein n=1 Tax=Passalora fulva TaxID=5499 RepID=A0A9Q8PE76_PASFU|nr:uncharacterized protein CLAFUR5_10935 [Fulvia fulva]UJO20810.1 hypothetical protein CLAFUR5_10935 [Fulvia fulva]